MRILFLLAILVMNAPAADWPQWRGPMRNGVVPDSPKLLEALPEEGLKELWESEPIPSNDEGGLSSPVVAGGRVIVGLVWHRDLPSETRQIGELVLRQLGHQSVKPLGEALVAKIEKTREELPPTLRGKKLEEFAQKFAEENFDAKQRQLYGGWLTKRFTKGALALPLDVLEKLDANKERIFPSEAEMKSWLDAQGWSDDVQREIIAAVPPTERKAEDALVCLDFETGKTVWKASLPGAPVGRVASSTPCVADGKVFAVGSRRVWCVNLDDGRVLWESPFAKKKGTGASPLFLDGTLVVNADQLIAFDAATGKQLWKQDKAGGGNASPVPWEADGHKIVICNGRDLSAVDLETGELLWTAEAGGDSTPSIEGDILAVQSRKKELGLVAYRITPGKAERIWSYPIDALRTQSSPIVHDGHVYLTDDNNHYCFKAATGEVAWKTQAQTTISSPVIADGKLFTMANNGNSLLMVAAEPKTYINLGRATVKAQWIPSPCIANGRLILRMKDSVKAWSLVKQP
jgi:outer membrane protein assembly factor BamB